MRVVREDREPYEVAVRPIMSMGATRTAVIAVAVSVAGCGSSAPRPAGATPSTPASSTTTTTTTTVVARVNDAILDCVNGEVLRDAGPRVSGATEEDVIAQAFAAWPGSSPIYVKDGYGKNRWVIVESGREIAIATPEMDGDNTWVVHDLQACGAPKTTPAVIDGVLDCVSDRTWQENLDFAADTKGSPTAHAALTAALKPFNDRYGGEIVLHGGTGTLVVDAREQVLARASSAPAGGFLIGLIERCDGYER
jgi:hypothetical protein